MTEVLDWFVDDYELAMGNEKNNKPHPRVGGQCKGLVSFVFEGCPIDYMYWSLPSVFDAKHCLLFGCVARVTVGLAVRPVRN